MEAIKAGGFLKGIALHSSVCLRRAHLQCLCVAGERPIRAPFCQWAAVCLCAEQATGPFSVCVYNSRSVHTLTHMLPLSPLSVSFFLLLRVFQSYFSVIFSPLFVIVFHFYCGSLTPLSSALRHYAKLPEKNC